ncbi:MAG: long-chain-fatty-acid--CoA ligase, partial [Candidatus Kariarchaeaceae archaeon]
MSSTDDIPKPWLNSLIDNRAATLTYEEIGPFEFFKRRALNETDDPCMILPKGMTLTYGEVFDKVKRMAARFQTQGVKKGDRIALLLGNTPHYVIAHYATLAIGGVVVQANPLYTAKELEKQLKDAGAKGIVTLALFQDKVNEVMQNTDLEFAVYCQIRDFFKPIIVFLGRLLGKVPFSSRKEPFDRSMTQMDNSFTYKDFVSGPDNYTEVEIDIKNDLAILQYTGGTTGVSKGAMLTHYNVSVNAQQARNIIHMIPEKTGSILTVLPMFHVFGLTACMNLSFQMGIPMILNIASPPNFDQIVQWIEKYKISFFPGVPAMMVAINNNENTPSTDLSSLIAVISGGAPLPLEVAKEFFEATGAYLVEGYGLSETSPLTHINPIGLDPKDMREGSIGLPAADTFAKIVDPEDYSKILPIGEVGELCLKGPQVFKGYWNMENETKNSLKEDGWFRTGDIAKMDDEGYAYIVDRKKDIIIVSGYNVIPREVEEALYEHPAVLEAAVAGMTHPKKGEMVSAWVVLKEGMTATEEEIIQHCKDAIAPYKVPKQITFRDELPKSM